jgi:thiol-disulfide isomerase/thioredoxin
MKLSTLAVLLLSSVVAAEDPGVFAEIGFEAACAKAKDGNRIVMVDFFTTWCGPCKKLDKVTWRDAKVVAWLGEKAVALKIDAEKEEALAAKYHIRSYPTVLLLRPDGSEIDRLVGYRDPEEFLEEAGDALDGRDSVSKSKALLVGSAANSPGLRLDYAEALAGRGRNEEALKEFLWCYDHGLEFDRMFDGARGGALLSSLASLAADFPPAKEALRSRRDACVARLLAAQGGVNDAVDMMRLNHHLQEQAMSFEVYGKLAKVEGTEELREAMYGDLFELLLEARQYGVIAAKSAEAIEDIFSMWEEAAAAAAKEKSEESDSFAEYMREELVARCGGYYEALLATGEKSADALEDRILKVAPSGATWAAMIGHAVRAGANEKARALAERGLKATTGEDAAAIREAAETIPAK